VAASAGAELHPDVRDLAPLLGTWAGRGQGVYPTIDPFEYLEEVVFSHVGKPFLAYMQKTTAAADGRPMHAETGYLRVARPGRVELVLAHPNGITEIDAGTYAATGGVIDIELSSTAIGLAPTAKEVNSVGRSLRLDNDTLSYTLRMGAVGQPLQDHLIAVLHRQG
jgi:hypothetical protein